MTARQLARTIDGVGRATIPFRQLTDRATAPVV